jgi:hypothetical protein
LHLARLNTLESEFFNSLLDLASWLMPVQGSTPDGGSKACPESVEGFKVRLAHHLVQRLLARGNVLAVLSRVAAGSWPAFRPTSGAR